MTAKTLLFKKNVFNVSLSKKHNLQYLTWYYWHNLLDSCDFPASCIQDFDYRSEAELVEVGLCAGHPLLMLEVERRECPMESDRSTFYLLWKSRGRNAIPSPNCTEVESYVDGWRNTLIFHIVAKMNYAFIPQRDEILNCVKPNFISNIIHTFYRHFLHFFI